MITIYFTRVDSRCWQIQIYGVTICSCVCVVITADTTKGRELICQTMKDRVDEMRRVKDDLEQWVCISNESIMIMQACDDLNKNLYCIIYLYIHCIEDEIYKFLTTVMSSHFHWVVLYKVMFISYILSYLMLSTYIS